MADFISGIVTVISELFQGLLTAFTGVGELIFAIGEAGAITGLTATGWLFVALIGVPLATWLFSKGFSLVGRLVRGGGVAGKR